MQRNAKNVQRFPTTRREFLRRAAAVGLAVSAPAFLRARAAGRKYRTALIGSGWWGTNIMREALAGGACTAAALCDVDTRQLEKCGTELAALTGDTPKRYRDYRELLEREKPDICIVATPDHWHPLATIAAIEAGAHVYVEKP